MTDSDDETGDGGRVFGDTLSQALLACSLDGIICIDDTGRVVEWNPACERTFGWTREDVLGRPLSELIIPHEHRAGHEQGMAHHKATGEGPVLGKRIEMPALTASGERILVELAIDQSQDGDRVFFTAYLRDITEREAAREALKAARDEAEEASRAKSRFLAVMSHEFRTPLHAIQAMADVLKGTPLTQQQAELVEGIETSASVMAALGDDILEHARIDAEEIQLRPTEVDIFDEVLSCVEAFSLAAQSKGLELCCHLDPALGERVEIDQKRWRQVVSNLIGNAVKYTSHGRVDVRLRAERIDTGDRLVLEVEDTGPGIAADEQDAVFDRFVRGRDVGAAGGAGLGLSVARTLAELMGGNLQLRSAAGQGSAFTLSTPLVPAATTAASVFAPLPSSVHVTIAASSAFRPTLQQYLARWGAQVTVTDGTLQDLDVEQLARDDAALVVELDAGDSLEALAGRIARATGDAGQPRVYVVAPFGQARPDRLPDTWSVVAKPLRPGRLRAALAHQAPRTTRPPSAPTGRPPAPARTHSRVLLAEDTPENQKLLSSLLRHQGHDVTLAVDGAEAVDLARAHAFDLILMDVEMPHLDGIDATQQIRLLETERGMERTPIVAVTAHALDGFRQRCLEVGMDHFVAKPISSRVLRDVVERFSDRRPTVLVAEDFPPARLLLERALSEAGQYRRRVASDGEQALSLASRGPLAAAILDLEMPHSDGREVARSLREAHPDAVLIALTGHDDDQTFSSCRAAGFDHVLRKPVSQGELREVLDAALAAPTPPASATAAPPPEASGAPSDRLAPDSPPEDLVAHVPQLVRDLVPAFLTRTETTLEQEQDWLEDGSWDALRRVGHNLKGSAGGYGFSDLGDIGARLERAAAAHDHEAASVALADANAALRLITAAWRRATTSG
jgi:PAS domain S-box-containing protein